MKPLNTIVPAGTGSAFKFHYVQMKRTIDEVIEIAQQKFKFHYVQMKLY